MILSPCMKFSPICIARTKLAEYIRAIVILFYDTYLVVLKYLNCIDLQTTLKDKRHSRMVLHSLLNCAKTAKWIKLIFGTMAAFGRCYIMLQGSVDPPLTQSKASYLVILPKTRYWRFQLFVTCDCHHCDHWSMTTSHRIRSWCCPV